MSVIGHGYEDRELTTQEIRQIVKVSLARINLEGRRVLVIIPDRTRTAPVPLMFDLLCRTLGAKVQRLDFLVALGTHTPLEEQDLCALVGLTAEQRKEQYPKVGLYNHLWQDPDTFTELGIIKRSEIGEIVGPCLADLPHDAGLLRDLPVTLNRKILEYDHLMICGPTFPHEVVGFSGGNKYFFPGISGPEVINFTHWLGAVVSSFKIIGTETTPVRQIIDRAASMIDKPKTCLSLVVKNERLAGLFVGSPEEAYGAAAKLSSRIHIRWLDKPVQRVLSIMPEMYDDIWTAAKGMYKLEPVIADRGEVTIYAPHIDEISYSHGSLLDEIGYHVCDYFLHQWDRFRDYPGGVLAHSTHLRGLGSYDPATGLEQARINVTLATRISPQRCRNLGLGYRDPATLDPETWAEQNEDALMVPKAGELLFRLTDPVS